MKKVTVVNIRLPKEIITWIDSQVEKKIYNSRSEAIREYMRSYILNNRGEN